MEIFPRENSWREAVPSSIWRCFILKTPGERRRVSPLENQSVRGEVVSVFERKSASKLPWSLSEHLVDKY